MTRDHDQEQWDAVEAALRAEGAEAMRRAAVPSAAVVWWRAQMRARREAEQAVTRPITIVQGLAVAAAAGLAAGLAGFAWAWLREVAASVLQLAAGAASAVAAIDVASRWIALPFAALVATALLVPLALYLIAADE